MRIHTFSRLAWLVCISIGLQAVTSFSSEESIKFTLNGYGFWQVGQIVKGRADTYYDHKWWNAGLLGFRVNAKPSDHVTITLNPEFKQVFKLPELPNDLSSRRTFDVAYIQEANCSFTFGDIQNPPAELRVGLFNYKYNPDVKDFGEYLFRTGTYPPFVINNFDWTAARLCGFNAKVHPIPDLNIDALLTTELQYYPLYDFSLSLIADYSLLKIFNIKAGVDFARLIPIDKKKSTGFSPDIGQTDINKMSYRTELSDTAYSKRYSFQATKLMAGVSIDFKAMLPELPTFQLFGLDRPIFSKEDLKLYGEIALTGFPVKTLSDATHPDIYGDISHLMPMMVGFNFWTFFGLFDVLSGELEYFPSGMPNDFQYASLYAVPLAYNSTNNPDDYKWRNLGWVIYAKKEVAKGFSIVGQAAYDHMRLTFIDGYETPLEAMNKHGDWAWQMKCQFSF